MFTLKNNQKFNYSRRLFTGGLAGSILTLSGCGGGSSDSGGEVDNQPDDPAAPQSISIVAIGDSIGTGFGIARPWPPILGENLGVPVDNNSISGEQTDFGARIIVERLETVNPTHVTILLGTNDAIRGSVSNAIANLQTMVDAARDRDVIPVIGTLPPITRSASEDARAQQINSGIRSLNGARVAGVRGAVSPNTIADGVHPNQSGQNAIAEVFANQI